MRALVAAFAGALVGAGLGIIGGSAAAIREANDRALQAREVANQALATTELQRETIQGQTSEIERLKSQASK